VGQRSHSAATVVKIDGSEVEDYRCDWSRVRASAQLTGSQCPYKLRLMIRATMKIRNEAERTLLDPFGLQSKPSQTSNENSIDQIIQGMHQGGTCFTCKVTSHELRDLLNANGLTPVVTVKSPISEPVIPSCQLGIRRQPGLLAPFWRTGLVCPVPGLSHLRFVSGWFAVGLRSRLASGALLPLGPCHLRVIARACGPCYLIMSASTCRHLCPGRVGSAPRLAKAACSVRPDRYTPD
jgi:hypothetical protein